MPEMRKNPLTQNWVIIAPERAKRPHSHILLDGGNPPDTVHHHDCHFCPGNEKETPEETLAYGRKNNAPNTKGWELRVVLNRFPAVDMQKPYEEALHTSLETYSYAEGIAEVIIETPHHSKIMAHYSPHEIELVLNAYKDRYIAISKEKHIKYVIAFKNSGKKAGASISHSHSQIIGIPIIPALVKNELSVAKKYFKKHRKCIYCEMIEEQLRQKDGIIEENDDFVCFMPYASRVPFEMWILPKFHSNRFENLGDSQIKNLAQVWKNAFYKLYKAAENPPYNYFIHTSPVHTDTKEYYHWHVEILPKTGNPAGFELGTGIFINISTPEENAKLLRYITV